MRVTSYDFGERMVMSDGVNEQADIRSILLENIPGAKAVTRANRQDDKTGVDWWVKMASGASLAVDAKVREEDWASRGKDDLALETWSVVESEVVGWTRNPAKRTDYVLWLWKDTGRYCLIPFAPLCAVFSDNWQTWAQIYQTNRQHTPRKGNGYHSECVFVPRREVWKAIYLRLNGRLDRQANIVTNL